MFIPGETVLHSFTMPFQREDIVKVIVSYRQNDDIILERIVYPGQIQNTAGLSSKFNVILSQEESLLFQNNAWYYTQLNVILTGNVRGVCKEMKGYVGLQHINEVVNTNG